MTKIRTYARSLALLATLGCNQTNPTVDESGEAGESGSGETGGGVAGSFYPLADGATFTFIHTLADQTQWNEELEVTAVEFASRDAFKLTDTAGPSGDNTESILMEESGAVARVHKEVFVGAARQSVVDYNPGFMRFDAAWLEEEVGFTEEVGYSRTEYDGQGQNPVLEDRLQRYTVKAKDQSVSVLAGDFEGCILIDRERVIGAERLKTFTFCPGVGKVEEMNHTNGNHEELSDFSIPG